MRKVLIGLIFFFVCSSRTFAQSDGTNQTTSLCGGRWELFQSESGARFTVKIDKYTGDILQFVKRKDGTNTWQVMYRELSAKDEQKQDAINYQLFASGMGMKYTFLVNINTGLSWQLVENKDGVLLFQVVE